MDNDENIRIYERARDELVKQQTSNSENYDKSILTLSSTAIGLTISFISNIVKIEKAICLLLLFFGWGFLALSIISTLVSFVVSQKAIKTQLIIAEKYYLKKQVKYLAKKNKYITITEYLNISSGICFILGILLILAFIITNINFTHIKEEVKVEEKKIQINEGTVINPLQKIIQTEIKKGITVNNLQPVVPQNNTKNENSGSAESTNSNQEKK